MILLKFSRNLLKIGNIKAGERWYKIKKTWPGNVKGDV